MRIRIYDSFSLKDKRKTVKGILDFGKNFNVSVAEVADQDMLNLAGLAFVAVSSDNKVARSILEKISIKIEQRYQVEILENHISRLD